MMIEYLKQSYGFIKVVLFKKGEHVGVLSLSPSEFDSMPLDQIPCDIYFHSYTEKRRNHYEGLKSHCQKLFDYVDLDKPEQKERFLKLDVPRPDFIIETSPKHYQLFWKPAKVDTLHMSHLLLTDMFSYEMSMYVRLPYGINTKNGHVIKEVTYDYFMEN